MDGARWVADNVLKAHPDLHVRVLAVWLPMLEADTHDAAETTAKLLSDPRVTRMWDPTRRVGYWFYRNVLSTMPDMKDREVYGRGITWDTFLVYGPQADWPKEKAPDAPLAAGATVMADHEVLGRQIDILEGKP